MASEILYKKIFQELLDGIRNGTYTPGSRLPSEMELAEQYGVSRITSKKALEMLADRGLVFRQPGKGTFVMTEQPDNGNLYVDDPDDDVEAERAGHPPVVGVIFDSFGASFGMDIIKGIEYECTRRGMLMMLRLTYGSIEAEKKALRDMRDAGVIGVIIMCAQDRAYNDEVLKLYLDQFPMVLVDREMKGIPIPVVATDNYTASFDLTQRLIRSGHRSIGYISHSHVDTSSIARRFEGFTDALREGGVRIDSVAMLRNMDAYIPKDDDVETNFQQYRKELSDFVDAHPELTAFYVVEFSIALLLHQVLQDKGLLDKKTMVYFDGFSIDPAPLSRYLHILQDQFQMGVTALRTLAHKQRGDQVPDHEFIPYLVIEPTR